MTALTDARARAADVLRAGLGDDVQVFATIPEVVTPPFVAIGPGDPYVEFEGAVFGGMRVRLAVSCIVAPGTNDLQAKALDELLLKVADLIDDTGDFVVEQVQQAGQLAVNNQAHLGATLTALTEVLRG